MLIGLSAGRTPPIGSGPTNGRRRQGGGPVPPRGEFGLGGRGGGDCQSAAVANRRRRRRDVRRAGAGRAAQRGAVTVAAGRLRLFAAGSGPGSSSSSGSRQVTARRGRPGPARGGDSCFLPRGRLAPGSAPRRRRDSGCAGEAAAGPVAKATGGAWPPHGGCLPGASGRREGPSRCGAAACPPSPPPQAL